MSQCHVQTPGCTVQPAAAHTPVDGSTQCADKPPVIGSTTHLHSSSVRNGGDVSASVGVDRLPAADENAPPRIRAGLGPLDWRSQSSWNRKTPRAWTMAQQSSGEFASANPTKGEEDARVQEHGIRAKISLNPRSHLYPAISGYRKRLSGNHVNGQAFLKSFDAVKRDRVTDALFMALHQISR
jgi:hypothetical protein